MPELIRSIANRLREFVGNRRRAPRHEARVAAVISLPGAKATARTLQNLPTIDGHTHDFSATGLALIVPAIRIGERYLTGQGQLLHITLKLPTGDVQLRAAPMRYEHLGAEGAAETGYLIGVHIREMSDRDRTLFTEYLRTLRKG